MDKQPESTEARRRFEEALHLQEVEGNPLTAEDHAMFAQFERDGLTDDAQRDRIINDALRAARPLAVE